MRVESFTNLNPHLSKTQVTPDVPYQLLDFPQIDPGFPNDSTGDQFFNAGQFDSYLTLGYFIGQKATPLSPGGPLDEDPLSLRRS